MARSTIDVDVVDVRGADIADIARRAGRGSPLHRRHRAYMDVVTIAEIPDDYESRLIDMKVGGLTHLRLLAFERHDLVLAKLARNTDRDREDVVALALGPGLNTDVLRSRYRDELRPTLGRPDREDLTLEHDQYRGVDVHVVLGRRQSAFELVSRRDEPQAGE